MELWMIWVLIVNYTVVNTRNARPSIWIMVYHSCFINEPIYRNLRRQQWNGHGSSFNGMLQLCWSLFDTLNRHLFKKTFIDTMPQQLQVYTSTSYVVFQHDPENYFHIETLRQFHCYVAPSQPWLSLAVCFMMYNVAHLPKHHHKTIRHQAIGQDRMQNDAQM